MGHTLCDIALHLADTQMTHNGFFVDAVIYLNKMQKITASRLTVGERFHS